MPIIAVCTACQKKMRVPDSSAGKKVRCPYCQSVTLVDPSAVAGPNAGKPLVPASPPATPPVAKVPPGPVPALTPAKPDPAPKPPPPPPPVRKKKEQIEAFDFGPQGEASPDAFDFPDDPEPPPESDDLSDEPRPRSPAKRKQKGRWESIASGILFIQIGVVIVALGVAAYTRLQPTVLRLSSDNRDIPLLDMVEMSIAMLDSGANNAIMLTVLILILASAMIGMGHIMTGDAPDPKAGRRAKFSFWFAVVSMVAWLGAIGSVIYARTIMVQLKDLGEALASISTLVLLYKVVGIFLLLAITTGLAGELCFALMLRRAAILFDHRRLRAWAAANVIIITSALTLSAALGGYIIYQAAFTELTAGEALRSYLRLLLKQFEVYRWPALIIPLICLGCYFYTLWLSKRLLANPKAFLKQRDAEESGGAIEDRDTEETSKPKKKRSS